MKKIIVAFYTIAAFSSILMMNSCIKDDFDAVNRHPEDTLYWHYIITNDSVYDRIQVVRFGEQVWTAHDRPFDNNSENHPWPDGDNVHYERVTKQNWEFLHKPLSANPPSKKSLFFRTSYNNWKNDMYNWYAFMQCEITTEPKTQGLCPKGFHVPSAREWDQLEDYLLSNNTSMFKGNTYFVSKSGSIANALASHNSINWGEGDIRWRVCNIPGTPGYEITRNNSAQFNVYPTGTVGVSYEKDPYGNTIDTSIVIEDAGRMAVYATSTEMETSAHQMYCTRIFYYNSPTIGRGSQDKQRFARLRCIKDDSHIEPKPH